MDNQQTYLYTLRNYQAVKDAEIKIDGITVLAGENGCGKSTLSRWVYYLVNTIEEFEVLVSKDFISRFHRDLIKICDIARREFNSLDYTYGLSSIYEPEDNNDMDYFINMYHSIFERFHKDLINWSATQEISENRIQRTFSYLNIPYSLDKSIRKNNISEYCNRMILNIDEMAERVRNSQKLHSKDELFRIICDKYKESSLNLPYIQLSESGNDILEEDTFGLAYNLKRAIYIDTPMALGHKDIRNTSWTSLQDMMINEYHKPSEEAERIIFRIKRIISGQISVHETTFGLKEIHYMRKDGLNINIDRAATGLNAFAYLQLLLQNGYIDHETLLLIDEPEAHLHPQWIVEFAKILVMINKEIGTKIMIASHNPDMVSAISSIAKKENIEDKTNFYVAERENNSWQYSYKELGTDISEIFKSFNIALSRIKEYGE